MHSPDDDSIGCGVGPKVMCSRHTDCADDEACLCSAGNESDCVPANSRTDADCSDGACVQTITGVGCVVSSFVVSKYCTGLAGVLCWLPGPAALVLAPSAADSHRGRSFNGAAA